MSTDKSGNDRGIGLSGRQVQQLRQITCLESVIATQEWSLTTTDEDLPENVEAVYMTPNAPTTLGWLPCSAGR